MSIADHHFMARALQLARQGLYMAHPNPRVGCVIVHEGEVVGEGWHRRAGEPHAEVHALQQAGERAHGATVYVNLEPCCHTGRTPPCTQSLINAGVARVVVAMPDPNPLVAGKGLQGLAQAGIQVQSGVLQAQAEELNRGFVMRMLNKRPWVCCKLAMSLDGRTALANGDSKWITGAAARADVQHLRAQSGAIMTGIGTVLADDPSLTVRQEFLEQHPELHYSGTTEQPLRAVLDSRLRMPEHARMLTLPGQTILFTSVSAQGSQQGALRGGLQIVPFPKQNNGVDVHAVLHYLAAQHQVNDVLLEAGSRLSAAMLQAGLIDELVIYMAPMLLGDSARGLFHIVPGLTEMKERIGLQIVDVRAIGDDWRITARPMHTE
ncbi:MAG TPA: bifunctional diaminohydroxyphosphoribosylaminopyrimidine deaminase/5-amino-6-(5-phosphoribosylamino)uracil reductase RibD [Gammaproteobacteria bacterium]|nr:bifunctional diaminohydroxyphosphoribosylaminopyrimidine deaminase/5-amino-6-(5-phosphoribosylamino)uracil reductase RibD [Gammaproteobacteria bacterium]